MKRLILLQVAVFMAVVGFSQTGPAGIGNSLGTGNQPENILWLDVNNLSLSDGNPVLSWPDASGNSNEVISTLSLSPFFENTSPLNGYGYLFFDQATNPDSRLYRTNAGSVIGLENTIIMVVRTTDSNDALISYATADDSDQLIIKNSGAIESTYTSGNTYTSAVTVNDGSWHILLVQSRSSDGAVIVTKNSSTSIGSVTSGYEIDPGGTLWIGHQQQSLNSNPLAGASFHGDIAEVISYSSYLNPAQRRIMMNYLSAKFDITISNDHYVGDDPGNGDYDFDVAGIGFLASTEHSRATSAGVTLYDSNGELGVSGEYVFIGHNNASATVVDSPGDVQAGIEQRWNRDWYLDKTTSGSLGTRIAFDLEAVGGLFPQNKDDYVLLKWNGSQYDSVNVGGTNKSITGSEIRFVVSDGNLSDGQYTLGTTDATNSPVDGLSNRTWYAYQSGDWTDWQVWTLDGAEAPLLTNPGQEKPGSIDNVVIGSGKTITVDSSSFDLKSIEIIGELDLQDETDHTFSIIRGAGKMLLSGNAGAANLPNGDYTEFSAAGTGGTIEVYGTGMTISELGIFNNAIVNMDNPTDQVTILNHIITNGNLDLVSGILQINDNSSTTNLELGTLGNITISPDATFQVGSGNARHQLDLRGNFNNNGGVVKFTNRSAADYNNEATDGIIDLNFLNTSSDQALIANGTCNFYRIEIDKLNATNILTLTASSASNFNLFGPANYDHDTSIDQLVDNSALPDNQRNLNALGLYKGTLLVGPNVDIPKLSVGALSNYMISKNAVLIVSGGSITKDEGTSLTVFGSVSNLSGTIDISASDGIILKDKGLFRAYGGTTNLNQLTTRQGVDGVSDQGQSYFQTNGTVNIIGDGGNTSYYNFHFDYETNVIVMSGGILNINAGSEAASRGIEINCSDDRVSTTGGNVLFNLDQAGTFEINSAVPLWNVDLGDDDGTGGNKFLLLSDFGVNADLTLLNSPNTVELDAAGFDLSIGRSFIIQDLSTYTTGGNNTIFTGNLNGEINLGTTSTQTFDGLDIQKDNDEATVNITSGNATVAVQVDDELRVESGNLDYGSLVVEAKSSIYIADSIGADSSTGKLVINGTSPQTITSSGLTPGTIFNIELDNSTGANSLGLTLSGDLSIAGTLTMTSGVFDINDNKLTIDGANGNIAGTGFSATKMIMTTGQFGDGGLEWYVDANETITYPIGTDATVDDPGDAQRYTPATMEVSNFSDDGYVRMIPADGVLATSLDPSRTLSFSWRVKHSGFSALPTVKYTLIYDVDDESTSNWNTPQPAKVVGGTRCQEESFNMNTTTRTLTFDGEIDTPSDCTDTNGAGFTLEAGQYTAGKGNAFNGPLDTYYTWRTADDIMEWDDGSGWSTDPDSYSNSGSKVPGAADVAIIQSDGTYWHRVATKDNLEVAALYFDNSSPAPGGELPQLDILSDNTVTLNEVSGEGHIRFRVDPGGTQTLPVITADIDGVLTEANSIIEYNATNEAVVGITVPTVTTNPGVVTPLHTDYTDVPNLYIGADAEFDAGGFAGEYPVTFSVDITAATLKIYNGGYLQTNEGANGDIVVTGNMTVGDGTEETILEYNGDGNVRTITVNGDLHITDDAAIQIEAGSASLEHFIKIAQDVNKDNTRFFLSKNTGNQAFLTWEFFGSGNHSFDNSVADEVSLYRAIINKGTDTTSTFTINSDFAFTGPTNDATSPVLELQKGLFLINHADVDIELSSLGEFDIPSASGLEVQSGRVSTNGSSAIRLDGLLRVSGGTVDTEDGNASSTGYIRASNTGSAKLEITGGTLDLAGSLRRDIESSTMVLTYNQTGGDVTVGLNTAGISIAKGSFEIMGNSSTFNFTGGTLTIVHGNGTQLIPSVYLTAGTSNVTQAIQLGNASTTGTGYQQSIGINSSVQLADLTLNNDSGNNPDALIMSNTLDLSGTLTLESGTLLDTNDKDLEIGGDFVNNGQFLPKTGLTTFTSSAAQLISGSSTTGFYDLTKDGTGTLSLSDGITINNDLVINNGTLYDDGNTISLLGDLTVIGDHTSNGGNGIVMEGTARQELIGETSGTSILGVLTIDNSLGVQVPVNGYSFVVRDNLRLSAGVLDIGGSLLVIDTLASIVEINTFGINNMIKTNNSFTDNGVQKNFPVGWFTDLIFPIGETSYNPITFDFSSGSNTSGTTKGSILVRPSGEVHPSISGTDTSPTNHDNVLQFYWVVDGSTLTDFTSTIDFQYNDSQVKADDPSYTEADYIGALFLSDNNPSNSVSKLGDIVDESNNIISVTLTGITDEGLSGDYFAGIDPAIQGSLASYETIASGNVADPIYSPAVSGGGAPVGAIVVVKAGHTLTFDDYFVNFYSTEIESTGEILVDGTYGHRLGVVTGTGTLNLSSNTTNVVLPAGQYGSFFSSTGGILEYSGSGSYNILGSITELRELHLSGSGDRRMGSNTLIITDDFVISGGGFTNPNNQDISVGNDILLSGGSYTHGTSGTTTITGDLNISGGTWDGNSSGTKHIMGDLLLSSGSFDVGSGGSVVLEGDINYTGGTFSGGTGLSFIKFNGTTAQQITGTLTGGSGLKNILMSNPAGLTLNNDLDITGELTFEEGLITTGANKLLLTSTASALPLKGLETSFVNGALYKDLSAGESFIFPIGKTGRWRYAAVESTAGGSFEWKAEYFAGDPTTDPLVDNLTPTNSSIVNISNGEYWKITEGSTGGSARVRLSWGTVSDVSPNSAEREKLEVMVWNDGASTWDNYGGTDFSSGHSIDQGDFLSSSVISFSEQIFTLGSSDAANALPVELIDFRGKATQIGILLSWETASELNNDYFEVQVSMDGEFFTSIGQVAGQGTVQDITEYEWLYRSPAIGINYFRLKQTDFNGDYEYSHVIVVNNTIAHPLSFTAYPQPASNKLTIEIYSSDDKNPVRAFIFSSTGEAMDEFIIPTDNLSVSLNTSKFRNGLYLLNLTQGNQIYTGKILIQH